MQVHPPSYYQAIHDAEKAAAIANGTMAFIGGFSYADVSEYYSDYYIGHSLVFQNPDAASWTDIRNWRPMEDGVVLYTKIEIIDDLPFVVDNIPNELPKSHDNVIIMADCALGDLKRYGKKQILLTNPDGSTRNEWVMSNYVGEYVGEALYSGYSAGGNPYYEVLENAVIVDRFEPDPTYAPDGTTWIVSYRGDDHFFAQVEQFASMAIVGGARLGPAWVDPGAWYVPVGGWAVELGGSAKPILVFDSAAIRASGYYLWRILSPVSFWGGGVIWPQGTYVCDLEDVDDQSLIFYPDEGSDAGYYIPEFKNIVTFYGLKNVTLFLPPDAHAYFADESSYVAGLIGRATFGNSSRALGGRFYEGFPAVKFIHCATNEAPCTRFCEFWETAANKAPLLRGGDFHDDSVNIQSPAVIWRGVLGGWVASEDFPGTWNAVTGQGVWEWIPDQQDTYVFMDRAFSFLAECTSVKGFHFEGEEAFMQVQGFRSANSYLYPFGPDYPGGYAGQGAFAIRFTGGPHAAKLFKISGMENDRLKYESPLDVTCKIAWDNVAWVYTLAGVVQLTAEGDTMDPTMAAWPGGYPLGPVEQSVTNIADESGTLAFMHFTGAAGDGDWYNLANWAFPYGGVPGDRPGLRTVVRISAHVTTTTAPNYYPGGPSRGARCRSLVIDEGFTVTIPVLIYEPDQPVQDNPQNAGFSHLG